MWMAMWLCFAGAAGAPMSSALGVVAPDPRTIVAHEPLPELAPIPVRTLRRNVLGGEIGWNTLAGAGEQYSRHLSPYFSLDAGLGICGQAAKLGLRARANLTAASLTPFVGLGLLYGTGTPKPLAIGDRGNIISYKVDRSPFVQATTGLAWATHQGFSLLASIGWAQLLRRDNVRIKGGTPTRHQLDRLRLAAGSGASLGLALGYSF